MEMPSVIPTGRCGTKNGLGFSNRFQNSIRADEVQKKISKEIKMGRISGPYTHISISNMRISPIGVVQKSTEGWRLITHVFGKIHTLK